MKVCGTELGTGVRVVFRREDCEEAVREPEGRAIAFLPDWTDVEEMRAAARACGAAARISVHHEMAMRLACRSCPVKKLICLLEEMAYEN